MTTNPLHSSRSATGLWQDKLQIFVQELNKATLEMQKVKKPIKAVKDRLDNRLTIEEIQEIGEKHGISCFEIAGYGLWDPTCGGYYRVIIAAIGDEIEVQNDHQAMILEDCDSPHLTTNFMLYERKKNVKV